MIEELNEQIILAATAFRAVGDPTRLQILRYLMSCHCPVEIKESGDVAPCDGTQVGDVCCHLYGDRTPSSNVSYHLRELRQAKLIQMKKVGRRVICSIDMQTLERLRFLLFVPNGQPDEEVDQQVNQDQETHVTLTNG